jgi:hypothetical protein
MNDETYSTNFYGMLETYMRSKISNEIDITIDTKMKALFNKDGTPMNTVFKKDGVFIQLHRELSNSRYTTYNYVLSIFPDTDTGEQVIIRQSTDHQVFYGQTTLVSKQTASFRLRSDRTNQTFDIKETSYDTLRLFIDTATTEWPMIINTLGKINTYDHVLDFYFVDRFKPTVRMDYNVRIESSSNKLGSTLLNAVSKKRELHITTAAEKTEKSDPVYNTPLPADTLGLFTVEKEKTKIISVNKADLQSKITEYLQNAKLETCFPGKIEQCVDRLMCLYE